MTLATGTNLGPYEILSPLGKGGMGEVYRARDTRLDREVAIKVLPAMFSTNVELKQRLKREAKAISNLSHPNICTLHDVGEENGVDYLVMEFLAGETLAQRLTKESLPIEQVLRIGTEIASALDQAHRAGVVHRDLKPGNIMLTKAGAKLLDFGLAKHAPGHSELSGAPDAATMTEPLTSKGTIVGTFQYMAPEQLEGKEADARTDIFAFGAVLYEMATGTRAFSGKSRASLITSIMSANPEPISQVQPTTPPALDHVVRMCLAKDPDDRIQTAHDVKLQLQWIAEGGSQIAQAVPGVSKSRNRERTAWRFAALAGVIAIAAVLWGVIRPSSNDAPAIYSEMVAPDGATFLFDEGPPALSPDGRAIVFVAKDKDDVQKLWLRSFNQPKARSMDGTKDASYPFWSPDGRSIGFFANEKLKRVTASGGLPNVVCDAEGGTGGTWNGDDVIVFSPSYRHALMRVSASGGVPVPVLNLDTAGNEFFQRHPCFLPDGKHFLYSSRQGIAGGNAVLIASLDGGAPLRLMEASSNAVYAPPGYLFYWDKDALRARPFDPTTRAFTDQPIVVAPETRFQPAQGVAHFTVSANGVLAYFTGRSATTRSHLALYDRAGNAKGTVAEPGNYYAPRLSHDGARVAVDNSGVQNNGDIWIYDIGRPMARRISFSQADESSPIWSPNDDTIVYYSAEKGQGDLYLKNLGSADMPSPLFETEYDDGPQDWSADGKYIVFERNMSEGDCADLWLLTVEDKTTTAITNTPCPFSEEDARISPDGKWLVYKSNESGEDEVYVQSFPEPGTRHQVSAGGGLGPRWREDSKEIVYITPDGMIMSAELGDDPFAQVPAITPLFKIERRFDDRARDFDMALDGQTFLVNTPVVESNASPLTLQLNWLAGLEDR